MNTKTHGYSFPCVHENTDRLICHCLTKPPLWQWSVCHCHLTGQRCTGWRFAAKTGEGGSWRRSSVTQSDEKIPICVGGNFTGYATYLNCSWNQQKQQYEHQLCYSWGYYYGLRTWHYRRTVRKCVYRFGRSILDINPRQNSVTRCFLLPCLSICYMFGCLYSVRLSQTGRRCIRALKNDLMIRFLENGITGISQLLRQGYDVYLLKQKNGMENGKWP